MAALHLHDQQHYALALVDFQTKVTEVLVKEKEVSVVAVEWKSDDLLLLLTQGVGGQWLVALDLRTKKLNSLDRLNREGTQHVVSLLPNDPEHVLSPWSDGGLRKINVLTGKSREVERMVRGVGNWIVDSDGNAWAGIGYRDEKWTFVWRSEPGAEWQRRVQPGMWNAALYPVALMPDRKRLVVIERAPGTPAAQVAHFDLATAKTSPIFADPNLDVTSVLLWGWKHEPCAAVYGIKREQLHFFHPEAAAFYGGLAEALPDHDLATISFSRDDRRALVRGVNDRDSGSYFLLDRDTGKISLIGTARTVPKPETLAPSRFFEMTARDGLALTGRVTLPVGVQRPPLVVTIADGIPGPRSLNIYDATTQFFASRGIATARIHIRGTYGLGAAFTRAGDLQLTTGMVRDLEDAVTWMAKEGWVDGDRVALHGNGFGGIIAFHAALSGRYKALVNFFTPMVLRHYELFQLSPSDRDNAELTAMLGGSAAANAYLKSLDPLVAAAKLTIPTFNYYPRGEASHDMVESGRLLKSALSKSAIPAQFHLQPVVKPGTAPVTIVSELHEATAAFLLRHL